MRKNLCMLLQPSISDASKISGLIPMIAAISIMVVFPNHIRKFIIPTKDLTPNAVRIKSMASPITPSDIKIELTGPLVENKVKNSMANADAMIRLGR